MRMRDSGELVLLAAIWGASFLFMRYAVPAFGPLALVELRVSIGAAALLPLLALRGELRVLARHAAPIVVVGLLNSALPFVMFSFALQSVTAGFAALLNATTPLWTALIGRIWLRHAISRPQGVGLAFGLAGVAILVWGRIDFRPGASGWAIVAALVATASYGVAANLARRYAADVPALGLACGSQLASALAVAPFALQAWPATPPTATAWYAAAALGLVCSAAAYVLYFRLIAHVGAIRSASVTFLIPVFAAGWGGVVLGETISPQMAVGGVVILAGTALVLGLVRWGPKPEATAAEGRPLPASR